MYFLKTDDFEFSSIKAGGYEIDEQPNVIAKRQFVNGKRKKILTSYTDVVIKITLGGLSSEDMPTYLEMLQDGTYEYYSPSEETYKTANFIVTKPAVTIKKAVNDAEFYFNDYQVILEKSSDYEAESESI